MMRIAYSHNIKKVDVFLEVALTWGGGETHYDKSNFKVKMNTATFYFLLLFSSIEYFCNKIVQF